MSKGIRLLLAVVLVVSALFGEKLLEQVKEWNNNEVPSVNTVEPSLAYKTVVKDIVSIDISKEDARQISDFFTTLKDVVKTDPGFIATTGQFREFNMTAGGLNFSGLNLKDKYPSLGEEIDEAIVSSIGQDSVTMSESKRKDLVECLNAIAWGVHQ